MCIVPMSPLVMSARCLCQNTERSPLQDDAALRMRVSYNAHAAFGDECGLVLRPTSGCTPALIARTHAMVQWWCGLVV
jgi:hypothetical protein